MPQREQQVACGLRGAPQLEQHWDTSLMAIFTMTVLSAGMIEEKQGYFLVTERTEKKRLPYTRLLPEATP